MQRFGTWRRQNSFLGNHEIYTVVSFYVYILLDSKLKKKKDKKRLINTLLTFIHLIRKPITSKTDKI